MSSHGKVTRRRFLELTGYTVAGAALAACVQPQPTAVPPTKAPAAALATAVPPAAVPATKVPATVVPPTAAPAAAAIKRGGTFVHAQSVTVPTMDPHINSLPEHLIYENVYDGLVRFKPVDMKSSELKTVGVLAESWEQKDTKTIIFKLRQGVKFHDGTDFDAEVAKWNFERCMTHAKSYFRGNMTAIEAVTAVDKYTLQISCKTDNMAILPMLTSTNTAVVRMVSRAAFEKNGEEWLQRNPVGTGAFRFKQWISDDRVILERNPDYFLKGADGKSLPYLDGLVLRYIPDSTVSLQDMRAGSVHMVNYLAGKDIALIQADPNLVLVQEPWSVWVYFVLGFNLTRPPFNDVRVRQAALYGVDREGMAKALGFGVGKPHYYPWMVPGMLGYDESIIKYTYNPDKAKELLAAAGYKDGLSIELRNIAREPDNTIAQFAQQMWVKSGINAKVVSAERLAFNDALLAQNFDCGFWRTGLFGGADPELIRGAAVCKGANNWSSVCDPEIDGAMNEALRTLDREKRAAIYRNMWKIINERAYVGTGYEMPEMSAIRKEVRDVDFNNFPANLSAAWLG